MCVKENPDRKKKKQNKILKKNHEAEGSVQLLGTDSFWIIPCHSLAIVKIAFPAHS